MGRGLQREHRPDKSHFPQGKMTEVVRAFRKPAFQKRETSQAKVRTEIPARRHPGSWWVGKVEKTPSLGPGASGQSEGLGTQTSLKGKADTKATLGLSV